MRGPRYLRYAFAIFAIQLLGCSSSLEPIKTYLYVGSYTDGEDRPGIYTYEFNYLDGRLTAVDSIFGIVNPSYLQISPNGKALYSCIGSRLESPGSVGAFKIDTLTGRLTFLNKQTAGGRNPVHIAISPNSRYVVSSNYTDAGISAFEILDDLQLSKPLQHLEFMDSSVVKGRQNEAHLHSTNFYNDGKALIAMDLGADKLRLFSVENGSNPPLQKMAKGFVQTPLGGGPRHFAFHPSLPYGYVTLELSGKIAAYKIETEELVEIGQYKSYQHHMDSYATADIHISNDGKYLYASNRNEPENSISIFKINLENGGLELVGHTSVEGDHPRNFIIDPSDQWLLVANQNSNSIEVFKRDPDTGSLTHFKHLGNITKPSCLKMRSYKLN